MQELEHLKTVNDGTPLAQEQAEILELLQVVSSHDHFAEAAAARVINRNQAVASKAGPGKHESRPGPSCNATCTLETARYQHHDDRCVSHRRQGAPKTGRPAKNRRV